MQADCRFNILSNIKFKPCIIRREIYASSQQFQINFTLCLLFEIVKQFFCFWYKIAIS